MKRKLKGFTLIEIIVVIAIIGVLAAILVPSMLGYVRKSKIQGANTTANALHKAVSSYATDLDIENLCLPEGIHSISDGSCTDAEEVNLGEFAKDVKPYFSEIEKVDAAFYISDGQCVAVSIKSGSYYGTYPPFLTAKNWDHYASELTDKEAVVEKTLQVNDIDVD